MEHKARPNFSIIIKDNEQAAAEALASGNFIQAYLLVHALIEALLRLFLRVADKDDVTFANLIQKFRSYLEHQHYPFTTFIDELTQFNRRRNRIVHQLWHKGYTFTNRKTETAAHAAVTMYGLLIEWLEALDLVITKIGFQYNGNVDPDV